MPDFSSILTIYLYVLIGSLLFIVILAAARAIGTDILHHDISLDHGTDVTVSDTVHVETSQGETQVTAEFHESTAGPSFKPGPERFQGMTLMTLSIFLVGFAATGILGLYYIVRPYNLDPLTSIPMAAISSSILAVGISYGAFKYFVASAAGSEVSLQDVVGRPCEVTVGTSGRDLGEVRCEVKGQIMSFPARSLDGARISSGDDAQIMSMTGNIAVIQKRSNQ